MKTYIKPSIEELNIGATMPLMDSQISGDLPYGDGSSDGSGTGWAEDDFAPGRKDKDYDYDDGW